MATKAKVATNLKRKELIEKWAERRMGWKATLQNPQSSPEEKIEAQRKLQTMPRNAHPSRYRNRCEATGRPRAFYRKFGLSRIALRELALKGYIPGVTKSSW